MPGIDWALNASTCGRAIAPGDGGPSQ